MNNRRKLIVVIGAGAFASPLACFAQQQPAKIPRVGLILASAVADMPTQIEALRAGLRDLGYVEGKNIVLEFRSSEGNYGRLPELAAELVRLKVDIIVSPGTPATQAAKAATTTIPIVMVGAGDPVGSGLVASLGRPGGNVTGTSNLSPPLMVKRLELLKEVHPSARRVAVLMNPSNSAQKLSFDAMEIAAKALKIEVHKSEVRDLNEIKTAFSAMAKQHIDAVAVANDQMLITNSAAIAELAAGLRIPSAGRSEFPQTGGLLGYGISLADSYRYSTIYIDKILKGAKPANLPVEQPSKYEVVVNLKTAKVLGIKIPNSILVRAEKVIE